MAQLERVRALSARFFFIRKRNETREIIQYKARLVVRGFLQCAVNHTFAPVVDFAMVRACLTVAIQKGYIIQQMDVRSTFLHRENDDDLYIKAPVGIRLCDPGKVLKQRRGLYGLNQAPRLWHEKWESVVDKLGFSTLTSDICVFRRDNLWSLLYVDETILIAEGSEDVC